MDHPSYLFIANSHPVARNVLIQPETSVGVVKVHELCVLHHFAGLHQVSGTFGRCVLAGPGQVHSGSPTDRHWILLVSIGHLQYSQIQTQPLPLSSRKVYCNAY